MNTQRLMIGLLLLASSSVGLGQLVHHVFEGATPGAFMGAAVDSARDVNGDGVADFVVGSYFDGSNGPGSGSVRVISGKDGSTLFAFVGNGPNDLFGYSVAGVGDLNGDNHADILVGTLRQGNGPPGYARVFSGADGTILYALSGSEVNDQFGCSVASAGDVDGDGIGDFIIGAQAELNVTGSATVFSGATGQILFKVFGIGPNDFFGGSVSRAGDVNADGFADVIVGARQQGGLGPGYVRVYSGPTGALLYSIPGLQFQGRFGSAVGGGVDINNDGHDDFIAGAPFTDTPFDNAGSVRVFSGATGGLLYSFTGASHDDYLGGAVALVPDLNGDGTPDILMNAKILNGGGQVRVMSGVDGSTLRVLDQATYGDGFGLSFADVPDINGDGFDEIIVGAPRHDSSSGIDVGKVVVLSICGARKYGSDPLQEMVFGWTPATGGLGALHVAFGVALAPAFVAVSVAPGATSIGGQVILVDIGPGQWVQFPITLGPAGSWSMPLDLTQASLNGSMFFGQVIQGLGSHFIVSNGVQLLFSE